MKSTKGTTPFDDPPIMTNDVASTGTASENPSSQKPNAARS